MKHKADVDVAVFEFLPAELKRYEERVERTRADVANSIVRVERDVESEVDERRRNLAHAEQELAQCLRGDSDCSGYRREVERRRRLLEYAVQARTIVQRAIYTFSGAQRRHDDNLRSNLDDGRKIVATAAEKTEQYRRGSAISGGSAMLGGGFAADVSAASAARDAERSPGWRSLPGVAVPEHYPGGFADVPLALVTRAEGASAFTNGQSVPDLEWAVDTLFLVVMPAMRLYPDPRPYLRERDEAEGCLGDRSYLRTYEGFFGSRAITLSPSADGTFDVVNGNHRILLLERAGETTIPARITGGGR